MTAKEFLNTQMITAKMKRFFTQDDVVKFAEMYGKHCAEKAYDDGYDHGYSDVMWRMPNERFDSWWNEFQKEGEK